MVPYVSAFELNAQLIFDKLAVLPVFKNFSRNLNEKISKMSREYGVEVVATSDSHRICGVGKGYIEINQEYLDYSSGDGLIKSIREGIEGEFHKNTLKYENFYSWVGWVGTFIVGSLIERISKKVN
jgi:hypothetical protein